MRRSPIEKENSICNRRLPSNLGTPLGVRTSDRLLPCFIGLSNQVLPQPGQQPKRFQWGTYATKRRWASYWHQIDETLAARPDRCLLVGSGDDTVADVLRRIGVSVSSLDIAPELSPDIVGTVTNIPIASKRFDVTVCCQVLEHIEYKVVPQALQELRRVTRSKVVISVPNKSRSVDLFLRVGSRRIFGRVHLQSRRVHTFNGKHHWELGTLNTPTSAFRSLIAKQFSIDKEYQVQEYAYHHFFVLTPR